MIALQTIGDRKNRFELVVLGVGFFALLVILVLGVAVAVFSSPRTPSAAAPDDGAVVAIGDTDEVLPLVREQEPVVDGPDLAPARSPLPLINPRQL